MGLAVILEPCFNFQGEVGMREREGTQFGELEFGVS